MFDANQSALKAIALDDSSRFEPSGPDHGLSPPSKRNSSPRRPRGELLGAGFLKQNPFGCLLMVMQVMFMK